MTPLGKMPRSRTTFPIEITKLKTAEGLYSGAIFYGFDKKYELLKGCWTLTVMQGDAEVVSKDFEVVDP